MATHKIVVGTDKFPIQIIQVQRQSRRVSNESRCTGIDSSTKLHIENSVSLPTFTAILLSYKLLYRFSNLIRLEPIESQ